MHRYSVNSANLYLLGEVREGRDRVPAWRSAAARCRRALQSGFRSETALRRFLIERLSGTFQNVHGAIVGELRALPFETKSVPNVPRHPVLRAGSGISVGQFATITGQVIAISTLNDPPMPDAMS
jgi:hypothetical protein